MYLQNRQSFRDTKEQGCVNIAPGEVWFLSGEYIADYYPDYTFDGPEPLSDIFRIDFNSGKFGYLDPASLELSGGERRTTIHLMESRLRGKEVFLEVTERQQSSLCKIDL